MKNSLLNLNKETVQTLERALDFYLDNCVWKETQDWCYRINIRTGESRAAMIESEEYKSHLKEQGRVDGLRKQIAYQKRLLKI